ncbi:MAG TPA: hypothetical protein VJ603_00880 [Paucimonas sp.]|nr:hypothetical protein [Paucimonas sp.]
MSKTPAKSNTPPREQQLPGAAINGGAGAQAEPKGKSRTTVKSVYIVGACPVLHDHELYQPGDELELTAAEAARLGGKVAPAKVSDDTAP